jgi:uncharacterized membrane protein YdbT with pleckstrin-like domain
MSHAAGHTMENVDGDETKLAEVHRHPIGIVFLYIQAFLGMAIAVGLAYFLLPLVFTDNKDTAFFVANIFTAATTVIAFLVMVLATYLYKQNTLILTSRNITQILQYGIFSRKVSQLNVDNVEDVTAVQNGFLPTIFNYGTLKIETAGEQMNFHFIFCPNAGYYAKIILDSKEAALGQMDESEVIKRHAEQSVAGNSQGPPVDPPVQASVISGAQSSDGVVIAHQQPQLQKTAAQAIKELGAETVKQATNKQ